MSTTILTMRRPCLKLEGSTNNAGKHRDITVPEFIPEEAKDYYIESNSETNLNFPVEQYPTKLKSLNLQKTPHYEGVLKGIKGQYLIFEDETVFNVRGSEGYVVAIAPVLS